MPLQGATLFAGDSMTVGVPPFVDVKGDKRTSAAVFRTAQQLLDALRLPGPSGISDLDRSKNLVVLVGANDLGGGKSAESIANTILAIWALGTTKGLRVFAMTLPPNKGWQGFPVSAFATINAKRKAVNAILGQAFVSGKADGLIDLSALMADPQDPDRLSPLYDSGDHLHPKKDAMGALLNHAFSGLTPSSPAPGAGPDPSPEPLGAGSVLLILGVGGFAAYMLTRKRWSLSRL